MRGFFLNGHAGTLYCRNSSVMIKMLYKQA